MRKLEYSKAIREALFHSETYHSFLDNEYDLSTFSNISIL